MNIFKHWQNFLPAKKGEAFPYNQSNLSNSKFTQSGFFFVFEPRPIFDLANNKTGFVLSPIIGKALGAGFNLIALAEIATTSNLKTNRRHLYQFGFNKNF